jgi:NAD(P)H dehydrogenase (quinone)
LLLKEHRLIVVTGATGRLGRLVIAELLERTDAAQVTAVVRNPDKASEMAARGVRVENADYDNTSALAAAFQGADRVLLISSNDYQRSVLQHTAAVTAAQQAGVGLFVYTSLLHADSSTLLTAAPHQHTEPVIRNSGIPFTLLRNALYSDNFAPESRRAVRAGEFFGSAGEGRVSTATRGDLAAAAAAVLTSQGHEGKVYELAGDVAWSFPELAAELSATSGSPVVYRNISRADHRDMLVSAGVPPMSASILIDTNRAISEGSLVDHSGQLSALIGRPTTSLAEAAAAMLKE